MPRLGVGLGIGLGRRRVRRAATPGVLRASTSFLTLSGQDATLRAALLLGAAQGSLALTGQAANLIYSNSGNLTLTADMATLTITGEDMVPVTDYKMPADQASFALSGQAAGLLANRLLTAGQGSFTLTGQAATLTKSSNYTGPGDVVSGAIGWYSPARAYSAAFAAGGTAIMDLVDQAGANSVTINILSTGFVDLTAINNWVTANSVTTIRVSKLYDQSGTGNHVTQATLGNMPQLVLSSLNSLPGLLTTNARGDRLVSGNITQAQPVSFSTVAKRTSTTSAGIIGSNAGSMAGMTGTAVTANSWSVAGGTILSATASDSSFHAGQGVLNGASSALVIDGSATTGAGGSVGYSAAPIAVARANGASFDGTIMEAGVWPSAFNATQYGNMNTNQHGTSGYNF